MKSRALVVILLLTAVAAFAQTESARISGRVTDPTDAVVVGALCTITNIETNVSITTTTNEDGIYVIPDLRPATYRLTIQKDGFRTVVQPIQNVAVDIDVTRHVLPVRNYTLIPQAARTATGRQRLILQ